MEANSDLKEKNSKMMFCFCYFKIKKDLPSVLILSLKCVKIYVSDLPCETISELIFIKFSLFVLSFIS